MSDQKRVLILSANPLFVDVISQSLLGQSNLELIKAAPVDASVEITEHQPDVIIVDEANEPEELGQILVAARDLASAQILLMNLRSNDFVVLESHRARIRKTTDLLYTIVKEKSMNDKKSNNPGTVGAVENARTRAGMYGFLAALFNQRPEVDLVRRLRTVGIDSFVTMTEEEGMNDDVSQGLKEIAQFVESTLDQPEEEVEQALAVDWTRLFRGVSPNYGPTPPYEGLYAEGNRDQIEVLQSINQIYHEEGATIGEENPNRPDYIGLELGFMCFLAEQEAEAWEEGEEERANAYYEKAMKFVNEHLGLWASKFIDLAIEQARTDFYKGLLRLTKGVIAEEVYRETV
ncbi:MAG: molecular chaperone TorD family protein [Anaerolineales bacterium]|nr:molecular chaperone TorD family protein [Anaerolineales bacterium]